MIGKRIFGILNVSMALAVVIVTAQLRIPAVGRGFRAYQSG
jgi:hypothetical protein